jgi:hypothetical protein
MLWSRRPPIWRWAILVWTVAILGVLGRVALAPLTSQSVVPIYLAAAHRWATGHNLYAPYFLRDQADVYRYPPAFAACFFPFTTMPPRIAAILWRLLSVGVFLSGLSVWTRQALRLPSRHRAVVFTLAAPLVLPSLNNGQTNLILIGLLLHGTAAAIRDRTTWAGLYLAVATSIKLYPAAVVMLLACAGRLRVVLTSSLALAALAAIPLMVQPQTALEHYRQFVQAEQVENRRHGDYQDPPRDLYWVLRTYFIAPSDELYSGIVLIVAAVMAVCVVVVARRSDDRRLAAVLALNLGCVWMTVFGPATEPATYTLLAPTAAGAVVQAWPNRWRFPVAMLGYVLLAAPIVRDFFPNGRSFHALGPHPIGGLLILAAQLAVVVAAIRLQPRPITQQLPSDVRMGGRCDAELDRQR